MGGKWKPLILFHLGHGKTPVRRAAPVSSRGEREDADQQLRELQADGITERVDFKVIPPKVEYSLTPLGLSLAMRSIRSVSGAPRARQLSKPIGRRRSIT